MTIKLSTLVESCLLNIFILHDLFSYDLGIVTGNKNAMDAYNYFYQACKATDNIHALHYLWQHLYESNDIQKLIFLQKTLQEIFPGMTVEKYFNEYKFFVTAGWSGYRTRLFNKLLMSRLNGPRTQGMFDDIILIIKRFPDSEFKDTALHMIAIHDSL